MCAAPGAQDEPSPSLSARWQSFPPTQTSLSPEADNTQLSNLSGCPRAGIRNLGFSPRGLKSPGFPRPGSAPEHLGVWLCFDPAQRVPLPTHTSQHTAIPSLSCRVCLGRSWDPPEPQSLDLSSSHILPVSSRANYFTSLCPDS